MSDTFKILTDAEHVRERLGMYAGSAVSEPITGLFFGKRQTLEVVPALLKIISEILDNSIDEAIRTKFEFANKIDVSIAKKDNGLEGDVWEVAIQDNGRGIPVEKIGNTDMYRPVIAWTQARAGSNFTAERETIGANGVGSFLTNVLSTSFVGETSDGTTYLKMVCNGMANVKNVTTTKSSKRFTRVTFTPDLSVFGLTDISSDHLDFIRDRLDNLAACYPEVTFTFNGDKIKFKDSKEYAARYCQHYVIAKDTNNLLVFGPSGKEEEFLLHSYVNGLWVRNGGTHVNFIMDKVIETLRTHILKKHKIEVLPNAIRQHMTLVTVFRGFQNLKFDSQTKERITNTYSEISSQLSGFDFDKIAKNILNTPEIIDPMIQAILYKKELEERRELEKKKKLASKKRVVSHISASSNDPDEKILFIAEGLCVHEDTEVFTLSGNKKIKDVNIGDYVLTHKHNFKQVVSTSHTIKTGIKLNGVIYSEDHRLFVYDGIKKQLCFKRVGDINKSVDKLVKNRLIENGLTNSIHVVEHVSKSGTVRTNRVTMKFSDTHDILTIDDEGIVSKTYKEIEAGDLILL